MNHIYAVLSSKLDALLTRITRINKVARKLGVAPVTLTVLRTYLEPIPADERRGFIFYRERTEVRIEGEAPKLDGDYTFVASIDPMGIVFGAPEAVSVPESLVERRGECEHCNLRRKRSETFVVAHEDGTLKLVGRKCLGDFLGAAANDPHKVWKFLENFASLTRDEDEFAGAFGRGGE